MTNLSVAGTKGHDEHRQVRLSQAMSRRKLHGTDKTISYQDDDRMKKILAGVEQGVSCEFDNADRITAACTRVCPATLSGSEISCHCRARLLH